jgi:hypothetical protein
LKKLLPITRMQALPIKSKYILDRETEEKDWKEDKDDVVDAMVKEQEEVLTLTPERKRLLVRLKMPKLMEYEEIVGLK